MYCEVLYCIVLLMSCHPLPEVVKFAHAQIS